jgi:hypothetical protein
LRVVVCIVVLLAAHDLLALFASLGLQSRLWRSAATRWRDRASSSPHPPWLPVPAATKPVLIMNLKSGGGKAEQFKLDDESLRAASSR